MVKEPRTEATALWKQRYRASRICWAEVARRAPSRGLAVTATSGTGQLYAWDVPTGALRQLTHRPAAGGCLRGPSLPRRERRKVWGIFGHWKVEDMVAPRDWLVREGIAQPDAILVTGGSYDGYLTLMALGKRPDLWTGGMALVTPEVPQRIV